MEFVILVDEDDNEVGMEEKFSAHMYPGKLHRAFSIFILNKNGHLLIQKRNLDKKTWPGFWSNSCCSHPRPHEPIELAGQRRLKEELGFSCAIQYLFKFQYRAQYNDKWGEHEMDYVFLGHHHGAVSPNASEVETIEFVPLAQLKDDMEKKSTIFTPWFRTCFPEFLQHVEII